MLAQFEHAVIAMIIINSIPVHISALQYVSPVFNKYLTVHCVIINHFSFPSKYPVQVARQFCV